MAITDVKAYEILDSRGYPTLEIVMSDSLLSASFSVPAGKSTGAHEAHELRDHDQSRYDGQGVQNCLKLLAEIKEKLIGRELYQQREFDDLLLALDGTAAKEHLGANLILGLSGAYCRLSARSLGVPLWKHIANLTQSQPGWPRIYANIINGGKHAPGLDVQEFMIVPKETRPSIAVQQVADFFHELGQKLIAATSDNRATLVGDEGGYAPVGLNHEKVWSTLAELDTKHLFEFACDAAASSFMNANQSYNFEGQNIDREGLARIYLSWDQSVDLLSVEDPFGEDDLGGFAILGDAKSHFFVVGDDVSVTSAKRITELADERLIGGVIIKPNQIGTVTETLDAISAAKDASIRVIVSHRSGETTDTFVSDLAYGIGAFGLKIGAPNRGERIAKYNRLIQIEQELL